MVATFRPSVSHCRRALRPATRLAVVVALVATLLSIGSVASAGNALTRDVDWVRTGGSTDLDYGKSIGLDAAGNTYVAAQVAGAPMFGDGATTLTGLGFAGRSSVAIAKYTPAGTIAWLGSITSTRSALLGGMGVLPSGDLVVAGTFVGDVSFADPPNDFKLTADPTTTSSFVVHLDAAGAVQWSVPLTSTTTVSANAVSISTAGIAVSATFGGTATVGSGASAQVTTAAGGGDLLVAHLDTSGTPQWVSATSSANGTIAPRGIATDAAGDAFVVGTYNGSVRWTSGGGGNRTSSNDDLFVLALDGTGAFDWVQTPGSSGADQGWAVAVDPAGTSVTIGGYVGGAATFGSGPTAISVNPPTAPAALLARFAVATGTPVLAKTALGPGPSVGLAVAVDSSGNAALGGIFFGAAAFAGPTFATTAVVTAGYVDGYVATFDATGAATSANAPTRAADGGEFTLGVALDDGGTVEATGVLHGSLTFTGASGAVVATDTETSGDAFVVRLPVHTNHPPTALAIATTAVSGTPRSITLSGADPDGGPVTFAVDGAGPAHGTLDGVAPNLTFTPDPTYVGPDSFSYTVSDADGASTSAAVTIDVQDFNAPPAATASSVVIARDQSRAITLTGTDPGGGALTTAVLAPPAHGSLTGAAPNLTYQPAAGYLGTDGFTFTVTDDRGLTSTGTVAITVKLPNVVMIMTDDQTLEQQRWLTQTNQLIGAQGTTFSDFIVSYSECCPARATFLTGQYAHNHGVLSSVLPNGGASKFDHANSLAPWLHANGYYTALSGKYLNGYGVDLPSTFVPPGWDDWYALYDPTTYEFFNYDISANGTTEHHGYHAADYSTDVLANHVDQQIRAHGGTAQPFFIDFTPTAPHVTNKGLSAIAAPRQAGLLRGQQAPRTPSFNNVNATLPPFLQQLPALTSDKITGLDNIYRIDAESLLAVDDAVAKVYAALRDTGELDNTIIMFTSDNGLHYGDHRLAGGKSDPYEETIRVPLLVRGPGFPAGAVVSQPTANIDLAPTITQATSTPPGRVADGVPLTNFVNDRTYGVHRAVITENGPLLGRRLYKGIRDDHYVYISWNTGDKELYDLVADPYETTNLVNNPARQLQVLSLDSRLRSLQGCAGQSCHSGIP